MGVWEVLLLKLNSNSNRVWTTGQTASLSSPTQARLSNKWFSRLGSWSRGLNIPAYTSGVTPIQLSGSEGREAKFCHDARPQGSQGCPAARTAQLKVLTKDGKPRQEMIQRYTPGVQGTASSRAVSLRGPTPQRELSGRRPQAGPSTWGASVCPCDTGRCVGEDEPAAWPGARGPILAGWGRGAGPSPEGRGRGALTSTVTDYPGPHRDPWTRAPAWPEPLVRPPAWPHAPSRPTASCPPPLSGHELGQGDAAPYPGQIIDCPGVRTSPGTQLLKE